jgi:hypothetical protein
MNPIFRIENNLGNTIYIPHQFIAYAESYLTKDVVVGTTVWPVENTTNFTTSNRNFLVGPVGSQTAENMLVYTSKTSTTITTSGGGTSTGVFAHSRGEIVQQVNFNTILLYSSPTASASGTWTAVGGSIPIQFNEAETVYQDTTGTSGLYYRIRLTDGAGTFSAYSNNGVGIASTSFTSTSVGSMIESVRRSVGNTDLPDEFFLSALNDARNIADTSFGYGRMNEWRQVFEYPIQMLAGTNFVTLPTNIDFSETNRSLLEARFARQSVAANIPIKYVDKREWNQRAYLNRYSTTTAVNSIGATSIQLVSTGDFGATGTISVACDDPTQTIMTVTYTGNNLLTNTLTGVTGVTRSIPSGTQCWAYSTFSIPYFFTVFEDNLGVPKLWFDRPVPNGLQGKNLYIDYYKKLVELTFLTDIIPEHYRDVYKDYLKFAIKRRRDDSLGEDDQDYKKFMRGLSNIMGNPYTGQTQIIVQ